MEELGRPYEQRVDEAEKAVQAKLKIASRRKRPEERKMPLPQKGQAHRLLSRQSPGQEQSKWMSDLDGHIAKSPVQLHDAFGSDFSSALLTAGADNKSAFAKSSFAFDNVWGAFQCVGPPKSALVKSKSKRITMGGFDAFMARHDLNQQKNIASAPTAKALVLKGKKLELLPGISDLEAQAVQSLMQMADSKKQVGTTMLGEQRHDAAAEAPSGVAIGDKDAEWLVRTEGFQHRAITLEEDMLPGFTAEGTARQGPASNEETPSLYAAGNWAPRKVSRLMPSSIQSPMYHETEGPLRGQNPSESSVRSDPLPGQLGTLTRTTEIKRDQQISAKQDRLGALVLAFQEAEEEAERAKTATKETNQQAAALVKMRERAEREEAQRLKTEEWAAGNELISASQLGVTAASFRGRRRGKQTLDVLAPKLQDTEQPAQTLNRTRDSAKVFEHSRTDASQATDEIMEEVYKSASSPAPDKLTGSSMSGGLLADLTGSDDRATVSKCRPWDQSTVSRGKGEATSVGTNLTAMLPTAPGTGNPSPLQDPFTKGPNELRARPKLTPKTNSRGKPRKLGRSDHDVASVSHIREQGPEEQSVPGVHHLNLAGSKSATHLHTTGGLYMESETPRSKETGIIHPGPPGYERAKPAAHRTSHNAMAVALLASAATADKRLGRKENMQFQLAQAQTASMARQEPMEAKAAKTTRTSYPSQGKWRAFDDHGGQLPLEQGVFNQPDQSVRSSGQDDPSRTTQNAIPVVEQAYSKADRNRAKKLAEAPFSSPQALLAEYNAGSLRLGRPQRSYSSFKREVKAHFLIELP